MKSIVGVLAVLAAPVFVWADEAGGIQWKPPAGWKSKGTSSMRAATYTVQAAPGDPEPGECAVFYFGAGQGGGVEANIDRWVGQFEQPDGKPSRQAAKTGKETVQGLAVSTIDLSGTYLAGGPMATVKIRKPGFRLLGAIVEAPQGNVFFKLTGPAKTIAAAQKDFRAMIQSVRR